MSVRRYGCRGGNRTHYLEGMNLTSCQCSTLPYRATVAAHRMYDESRAGRDGGQKPSWIYTHFIINQTGKTRKKRRADSALFFSIQATMLSPPHLAQPLDSTLLLVAYRPHIIVQRLCRLLSGTHEQITGFQDGL